MIDIQRTLVLGGCLALWFGVQAALFILTILSYYKRDEYGSSVAFFGPGLAIAKASAVVINLNLALMILSMCRLSLTMLNRFNILPCQYYKEMHKLSSMSVVLFSIIHTVAHYFNFAQIPTSWPRLAFLSGPGATGHVMWVLLLLAALTSIFKAVRRHSFEIFWYCHHAAFLFIKVACVHGAFCFVKRDFGKPCSGPTTWKWVVGPAALYILEVIWREIDAQRFTFISKIIIHQPSVFEIQIKKPSFRFRAGEWVYLSCRSVSWLERHPFTLTSAPEDSHLSVHIRILGDWTRLLAKRLGIELKGNEIIGYDPPNTFPNLLIVGPYGSACQSFDGFEVVICVGAGIGQTPFASILRSLWYALSHPYPELKLKKVLFYGISKDIQSMTWFLDVLRALERENKDALLELNIHITGPLSDGQAMYLHLAQASRTKFDPITGLHSPTRFGRPNFRLLFAEWKTRFPLSAKKVGVFYCGPRALGKELREMCGIFSGSAISFKFHQETF